MNVRWGKGERPEETECRYVNLVCVIKEPCSSRLMRRGMRIAMGIALVVQPAQVTSRVTRLVGELGCRDHNGARDACRVMPRCREPRRRRWERRGDRAVENARRPVTRAAAAPMHTDRAPRRGPGVAARQNRLRCSAVGAAEVAAWRCRRPCPAARPAMPPSMTCNTPDAKLTCQTRLLTQPRQARVAVAAAAAAEQRWSRLGVDARHPGS